MPSPSVCPSSLFLMSLFTACVYLVSFYFRRTYAENLTNNKATCQRRHMLANVSDASGLCFSVNSNRWPSPTGNFLLICFFSCRRWLRYAICILQTCEEFAYDVVITIPSTDCCSRNNENNRYNFRLRWKNRSLVVSGTRLNWEKRWTKQHLENFIPVMFGRMEQHLRT